MGISRSAVSEFIAMAPVKKSTKGSRAKKVSLKFVVDCNTVAGDNLVNVENFVAYLAQRTKVDGKTGNLGNSVSIESDKNRVVVKSEIAFSKATSSTCLRSTSRS